MSRHVRCGTTVVPPCSTAALAIIPSQVQETCTALSSLGSGAVDPQLACTPNDDCNQVTCTPNYTSPTLGPTFNSFELQYSMSLLPCEEPDRVALKVITFSGPSEVDSFTYTDHRVRSIQVQSTDGYISTVTLTVKLTQLTDGIQIHVSIDCTILLHPCRGYIM